MFRFLFGFQLGPYPIPDSQLLGGEGRQPFHFSYGFFFGIDGRISEDFFQNP